MWLSSAGGLTATRSQIEHRVVARS
jgi:hypothetical protein